MREHNVTLVHPYTGPDAIGGQGVPGDPVASCVHPSPFGTQCTMHSAHAMLACLSLAACTSLTCPSPEPYQRGARSDGIHGPICQARAVSFASWQGGTSRASAHGMCKPSGCHNFFLSPIDLDPATMKLYAATAHESGPGLNFVVLPSHVSQKTARSWLGLHPQHEVATNLALAAVEGPAAKKAAEAAWAAGSAEYSGQPPTFRVYTAPHVRRRAARATSRPA